MANPRKKKQDNAERLTAGYNLGFLGEYEVKQFSQYTF